MNQIAAKRQARQSEAADLQSDSASSQLWSKEQVAGDSKRLLDHSGDELPYSQLKGLPLPHSDALRTALIGIYTTTAVVYYYSPTLLLLSPDQFSPNSRSLASSTTSASQPASQPALSDPPKQSQAARAYPAHCLVHSYSYRGRASRARASRASEPLQQVEREKSLKAAATPRLFPSLPLSPLPISWEVLSALTLRVYHLLFSCSLPLHLHFTYTSPRHTTPQYST